MDFEQRLENAIQRGERLRSAQGEAAAAKALSEEEFRNLHSSARINLSEHIETGLKKLAEHFLGFRFETLVDDSGWGAKISRDDVNLGNARTRDDVFSKLAVPSSFVGSKTPTTRRPENHFSRFQVVVKPYSVQSKIVEISAKGTVRNKEILTRSHYHMLTDLSQEGLADVIDNWMIEYAEKFAAQQ